MSEDYQKLQQLLEQATSDKAVSKDDLDPEVQSFREAWLDFGQLLEAAQPDLTFSPLSSGEGAKYSPLPTNLRSVPGEGLGVRAVPRSTRIHRWLWSSAALVAASLLIGVLTIWTPQEADQSVNIIPNVDKTAAIKSNDSTLIQQQEPMADELQWDDSLDEQISEVAMQILYARQDTYTMIDADSVQYGIEQMQKDLDENNL